jgi:hypothetical protein
MQELLEQPPLVQEVLLHRQALLQPLEVHFHHLDLLGHWQCLLG